MQHAWLTCMLAFYEEHESTSNLLLPENAECWCCGSLGLGGAMRAHVHLYIFYVHSNNNYRHYTTRITHCHRASAASNSSTPARSERGGRGLRQRNWARRVSRGARESVVMVWCSMSPWVVPTMHNGRRRCFSTGLTLRCCHLRLGSSV